MNLQDIKTHWLDWAKTYSTDLRATTKTQSIKKLEIKALYDAFLKTSLLKKERVDVLEIGCGNGYNCISLSKLLANFNFTGVDYISDMVESAKSILKDDESIGKLKVEFYTGDALELENNLNLKSSYDAVFTDRCIINLNTKELQEKAIGQLINKTKDKGYIIILENFLNLRANQNSLRQAVNLPPREIPDFNTFLKINNLISFFDENHCTLLHSSNFGSLHDIILYVIVPMLNEGKVDYEHPVVEAVTQLCLSLPAEYENLFGEFGQNRLYLFQKNN